MRLALSVRKARLSFLFAQTTASAPDRIWRTLRKADGASAAHGEVVCGQWRMSGGRVAVKLDYGCSETGEQGPFAVVSTGPDVMRWLIPPPLIAMS